MERQHRPVPKNNVDCWAHDRTLPERCSERGRDDLKPQDLSPGGRFGATPVRHDQLFAATGDPQSSTSAKSPDGQAEAHDPDGEEYRIVSRSEPYEKRCHD